MAMSILSAIFMLNGKLEHTFEVLFDPMACLLCEHSEILYAFEFDHISDFSVNLHILVLLVAGAIDKVEDRLSALLYLTVNLFYK